MPFSRTIVLDAVQHSVIERNAFIRSTNSGAGTRPFTPTVVLDTIEGTNRMANGMILDVCPRKRFVIAQAHVDNRDILAG